MVQEETWHIDMLLSYKKDLNMNGFYIGFIGHHVLVLLIFLRVRSVIVLEYTNRPIIQILCILDDVHVL
jgi:hypothetical protein